MLRIRNTGRGRDRSVVFSAACCLALAIACLLSSCVSDNSSQSSNAPANRVWPAAPAEARLSYVQSIYSPKDIGLNPSGWSRLGKWLTGQSQASQPLVKPFGIAVDEAGDICLTDTGAASVCYFDRVHHKFQRWSRIGKLSFQSPVAVVKRDDDFFVADSALGMVIAFDREGKLRFTITNSLARPVALALTTNEILVADSQLHRVAAFDLQGGFLFQFGRRGAGPGEFNFPTHLAVDGQGHVFVTDSMNSRIQMFDAQGHFLGLIGAPGDASGHFNRPKGVAADSFGHIYVVDAMFDNVQIFDTGGRFLLDFGSTGSGPGEFWLPAGIAISGDNQIFVADSYNRRIQVFKYIGTP
jgi:DNA-binding beta-propeller fold protein YncE